MSLAGLTQQKIRDTVRQIRDVDSNDLPDVLIDLFTRDAFEQIDSRYSRWPHREVTYDIVTTPGDGTVSFAEVSTTLDDIRSVLNVTNVGYALEFVAQDEAERWFVGATDVQAMPVFWSVTGDNVIHLWPRPESVYTLRIRGFRSSTDWLTVGGAGASPDLPVQFHTALVYKVISLTYAAQDEDPEMAHLWEGYYQAAAAVAESAVFRPTEARPRILHGKQKWPWPSGSAGFILDLMHRRR